MCSVYLQVNLTTCRTLIICVWLLIHINIGSHSTVLFFTLPRSAEQHDGFPFCGVLIGTVYTPLEREFSLSLEGHIPPLWAFKPPQHTRTHTYPSKQSHIYTNTLLINCITLCSSSRALRFGIIVVEMKIQQSIISSFVRSL